MNDTKASITSERLEVRNNVVRHLILIFCGLCLAVAAVLAAFAPLPYADNELLLRVGVGYFGLPVSLAIIALNIHKIANRREAILIDSRGITDRSNALASGFTPWDDIKEVYLLRLKSDDFLCAEPVDYHSWYAGLNPRQQRLADANRDAGFAPIRIQFRKVSDSITSKEGVSFVKKLMPKKVGRIRKPRY